MDKIINWFNELSKEDIPLVGGKGANLGEMTNAKMIIPPGFVVNVCAYDEFLEITGIKGEIMGILKETDVNDSDKLDENAQKIRNIIINAPLPGGIASEIRESYFKLGREILESGGEVFVAVRSSATAEDVPDASFAGQQDTYLNIRGADNVIKMVQKCWASLFTARAIFYREENNFVHEDVSIAVVVQKMVNSTSSGVMFTVNPVTHNKNEILIEAVYGLGEAIVGGEVTPDNYIVDKNTREIKGKIIGKQTWYYTKEEGKTIKKDIEPSIQDKQKISDENIKKLAEIANNIHNHYGMAMDIEWAAEYDNLYITQARPETTISKTKAAAGENKIRAVENVKLNKLMELTDKAVSAKDAGDHIVKGYVGSPGVGLGKVVVLPGAEERHEKGIKLGDALNKIEEGDIMVTTMTDPNMVPGMKRAGAIVTDEGGMTCHAAIVSRELGIPCVIGSGNATRELLDGMFITVDATKGIVYNKIIKELLEEKIAEEKGKDKKAKEAEAGGKEIAIVHAAIITATEVKVNIDFPELADTAVATGADGVGLLRAEHMFINIGMHPGKMIAEGREDELIDAIANEIAGVAGKFTPRPVWYRTLDAPTDEFREMEGGENEPKESNPMLGWRGIRRSVDEKNIIACEFKAIKKLRGKGIKNVGVMLPLVQSPEEVRKAKEIARSVGLEPQKDIEFGVMVETPAAALIIDELIAEGIDFISFGTNDLTQYTLAVDRNNANVTKLFRETHPAVLKLIEMVIKKCYAAGVKTSICGQAGSYPDVVEKLVKWGITSVSANIDAVQTIRETVARVEKKLLVDNARRGK